MRMTVVNTTFRMTYGRRSTDECVDVNNETDYSPVRNTDRKRYKRANETDLCVTCLYDEKIEEEKRLYPDGKSGE